MRPAYLTALASRTLGMAPLLHPVTPSRFEPEGLRPGGWAEISEMRSAAPGHPPSQPADAGRTPIGQVPGPQPEPPLIGSPLPAGPHGAPERVEHVTAPAPLAPLEGRPAATPAPVWPEPPVSVEVLAYEAALLPVAGEPGAGLAAGPHSGTPPEDSPGSGGRGEGPGPSSSFSSSPQPPAVQPRRAPEAPAPAIVVHIGRVDVRAVQAPAPPPPPPRPRPPAGPSLEEHLLARDRGRR